MKTRNNDQKKVNGQLRKMVLRGSSIIISLVLISCTVGAQNFWDQVLTGYNYGKMAMSGVEDTFEIKGAETSIDAFIVDQSSEDYNALENANEAIDSELAPQVEALENSIEYHAADYVAAEFAAESQKNNTIEVNFETVEAELVLQVQQYNASEFVEAEFAAESQKNNTIEVNFETVEA
ncbi:MAG: hypothetical protein WCI54_11715, partial [Bacteroidia bacterium]